MKALNSVETSKINLFYGLGSEVILPALVRYPEVLPTLATCAVFYLNLLHVLYPNKHLNLSKSQTLKWDKMG
jgi:hypothetical protein